MARTIAGVRSEIITAISTASMLAALGLDDADTILDRDLDVYRPLERAAKISANVVGSDNIRIRAWTVVVTASEDQILQDVGDRTYSITLTAYYEPEDVNTMLDHGLKVIEAIKDLGINLNGTVQTRTGIDASEPVMVIVDDDDIEKYVTMSFNFTARDTCPEY